MKRVDAVGMAVVALMLGLVAGGWVRGDRQEMDESRITEEVVAHLQRFAGPVADQSVELWDEYFLVSPNIGNKHGPEVEIGWDLFHQGNIQFFSSAGIEGGSFQLENIEVFPINPDLVWAKGDFISTFGGVTTRSVFFDALVRAEGGWRAILSYVESPTREGND